MRPKKLEIKEPIDMVIAERIKEKGVLVGSRLYCGQCGEQMGIMSKTLQLPFSIEDFMINLIHSTVEATNMGLYHSTCENTLFTCDDAYRFASMENFLEQNEEL